VLLGWELIVLVAIVIFWFLSAGRGLAWLAPPLGALAGNTLPLQIAVRAISKAAR
jgi:hypothetical protein